MANLQNGEIYNIVGNIDSAGGSASEVYIKCNSQNQIKVGENPPGGVNYEFTAIEKDGGYAFQVSDSNYMQPHDENGQELAMAESNEVALNLIEVSPGVYNITSDVNGETLYMAIGVTNSNDVGFAAPSGGSEQKWKFKRPNKGSEKREYPKSQAQGGK